MYVLEVVVMQVQPDQPKGAIGRVRLAYGGRDLAAKGLGRAVGAYGALLEGLPMRTVMSGVAIALMAASGSICMGGYMICLDGGQWEPRGSAAWAITITPPPYQP